MGDSFTTGVNVDSVDRWPDQLADTLSLEGIKVKVTQLAHPNWTTGRLLEGLGKANLEDTYDLVSLMIGMFNQSHFVSVDQSRKEFTELLKKAIELAKGQVDRVFVLSIPDYSFTPYAAGLETTRISSEILALNLMQKSVCESAGIAWLDITAITQQVNFEPDLVSDDDFHPSVKMYARWVETIYPDVLGMLELD